MPDFSEIEAHHHRERFQLAVYLGAAAAILLAICALMYVLMSNRPEMHDGALVPATVLRLQAVDRYGPTRVLVVAELEDGELVSFPQPQGNPVVPGTTVLLREHLTPDLRVHSRSSSAVDHGGQ